MGASSLEEFKFFNKAKQDRIINNFKQKFEYQTHINPLTGGYIPRFKEYLEVINNDR